MKYLMWLLKAAIFFTLFAFALNNQQVAQVHFFFGYQWQAPMVLIVLIALACGMVVGALGMLPHWWRDRRKTAAAQPLSTPAAAAQTDVGDTASQPVFVQPDAPADEPARSKRSGA